MVWVKDGCSPVEAVNCFPVQSLQPEAYGVRVIVEFSGRPGWSSLYTQIIAAATAVAAELEITVQINQMPDKVAALASDVAELRKQILD